MMLTGAQIFVRVLIEQGVDTMFGSIISRLLGRQQTQDATRYASTAFFTCFGIGCLLTVGGLLFLPP